MIHRSRPGTLILCALGLLSPLLALLWHEMTGDYVQDAFLWLLVLAYALSPLAVWRAAARSRKALFGYGLSLAIPASIGVNTLHSLNLSRHYMENPNFGCGMTALVLFIVPFMIGGSHILGGVALALVETARRRFDPEFR